VKCDLDYILISC